MFATHLGPLLRGAIAPAMLMAALPAFAANCGSAAIGARFTEAARLCDRPEEQTAARFAAAAPLVETPSPVSVRMPGKATRLRQAARSVRASGAPPTGALIGAVARQYRINPHLLASMVRAESAGRQTAVSHKGALGLMQVMPATARSLGVANPNALLHDPVLAVSTGAAYLKQLQRQFGNDVPLVVAAYNAGPGAVVKAGRRIPKYRETQGYVRKVMGGYTAAAVGRSR